MTLIAPYGSWPSPISASDIASGGHPVAGGCFVKGDVWWLELRPDEGGRYAVRRRGDDGQPVDVLSAPWNARSRVHEYGGGAWVVSGDGRLVFAEFTDQRLYRLDPGDPTPTPLTAEPTIDAGVRFGELSISADGSEVWCVRETHDAAGKVVRDICAVPVDGSGALDPTRVRSVVAGSDFLAYPRVSPDGTRLAWIAWNHPQMPWDGTELRIGELSSDGICGKWQTALGSATESVLQPEWIDEATLSVISDRTGWWNLYRIDVADPADVDHPGPEPIPLCERDEDFGGPLWQLGAAWYAQLADRRLLTVRTFGLDHVAILDPATGSVDDIDLGDLTTAEICAVDGTQVLLLSGGAGSAAGLRVLDLESREVVAVRLALDELPDPAYLPRAQPMDFDGPGGREVHAFVYPPRHPDAVAPEGELPPYVAIVHGGPTAHSAPMLSLTVAYFTSRGIGVVDINYGGSTGYGRAYRERLRGEWGVVDVEDTVAVVRGLADRGFADGARLAIRGGSAGGWTVLAALTGTVAFACGASYYGVAELVNFVAETHDFESRYLDGMIGPLPAARELYDRRAPLNNVDGLSCPVLLLQGLDDPIVPPSQAEQFRDALVAKGIPHAYLAYAGESHGFRRAETIIDSLQAELSFYGQVMGFDPPGIPRLALVGPP